MQKQVKYPAYVGARIRLTRSEKDGIITSSDKTSIWITLDGSGCSIPLLYESDGTISTNDIVYLDDYPERIVRSDVKAGTKVIRGRDWAWAEQGKMAAYGIVTTDIPQDEWVSVEWVAEDGTIVSQNSYRVGDNDYKYDLYYYNVEDNPLYKEHNPNPKPEEQMKKSTGSFELSIPDSFIYEKFDGAIKKALSDDRLEKMVDKTVGQKITGLQKDLSSKLSADLTVERDKIIESFLESKQTKIYLDGKLTAHVKDPMAHKEITKLLSFLQLFKQAMIVGPTGSGKSTLAKQAADALGTRYGSFSCNAEASKSELVGFANLNGYVTSQFLDFYENGGVFLVDEYDAMSPSIAVVLNAAFDRTGQISVPNRTDKPVAKKHPNFYCILAGNTWGSGSVEYQGREMQDMAFLDRFKLCRIHIGYDEGIEKNLSGSHYEWFMKIRSFINNNVDGEEFSTRSIYDASTLISNGFEKNDVLTMISSHWEPELHKKLVKSVGVN